MFHELPDFQKEYLRHKATQAAKAVLPEGAEVILIVAERQDGLIAHAHSLIDGLTDAEANAVMLRGAESIKAGKAPIERYLMID